MIVNYRTAELTIQCLESLQPVLDECDYVSAYVVDNASGDDSPALIENAIRENDWRWARLVQAKRNGGFAYGNNVGMAAAEDDHETPFDAYWLLNSDTIVRPGALKALVDALDVECGVGIVGSRLEDPDGSAQISAFRFHTAGSELARGLNLGVWFRLFPSAEIAPAQDDARELADWVAGASMLIDRKVIDQVGLLDEDYFLYYEEVDYCLRARRLGWKTSYVSASRVVHLVGQSSNVTERSSAARRLPKYWFESRAKYFEKNYGRGARVLADVGWLAGHLLYRARRVLQNKHDQIPKRLVTDFILYNLSPLNRVH
ncbi:glycosyltransferase family 2 protein [Posidoniimonas polymericola]|uniref:glycosyltransferase family 2 protein n=1 Tax=Posidoniimonas polymericola TaxID=2528002 RepID=UPI0018D2B100|nr:glycosyltransferase family 2 protein [Posidoniimonas polymericola]